jgi:glycosyltransferase involved in cell wall biosynthesis
MPVRNGEAHLGQALRSVLAQTFTDLEVVVCDNASTDRSVRVVEEIGDPRVRLLQNDQDIGGIANWNKVAAAARGKYVKLMAADDLLYPDALAAQVAVLEDPQHADVVFVASRRDIIDTSGMRLTTARGLGRLIGRVPADVAVRTTVRSGTNVWGEPHCVLFRREALPPEGAFRADRSYMVDVDLWCRLLRRGDAFALPRTVGAFRVHAGAESVRVAGEQSRHAEVFFRALEAEGRVSAADRRLGVRKAHALGRARRHLYRMLRLGLRLPAVGRCQSILHRDGRKRL